MKYHMFVLAMMFAVTSYAACVPEGPDTDGDGITDNCDNCIELGNRLQRDVDNDGCGNVCDADFDNNGIVNHQDARMLEKKMFSYNSKMDIDNSGFVNYDDLMHFTMFYFKPPGPSGLGNCKEH